MNDEIRASNNGHSHLVADSYGPPLELPTDLDELRQRVLEEGHDLSQSRHQQAIAARRAKARDLAARQQPSPAPRLFGWLKRVVLTITGALVMGVVLFAGYMLLPVGVIGLWLVEVQRVQAGAALFDPPRAQLMAVVTVSIYVSLLIVRAGMLRQYTAPASYNRSLRLWAHRAAYFLGLRRHWRPEHRTELQMLDGVINSLVLLIVLLGTVGTLQAELGVWDGWWLAALQNIVTQSELVPFLSLAGGAVTTAILLRALHYVVELTFSQYMQVLPEASIADFFGVSSSSGETEAEQAEVLYLQALLLKSQQEQKRLDGPR